MRFFSNIIVYNQLTVNSGNILKSYISSKSNLPYDNFMNGRQKGIE